ncbi:fatty acid--CoA ligase family protein [Chromobacterium sp. IIBBL 290-4]|uniref:ANL family adenylate-forming protein n=1 Tax=Chromobacterium sp. IIBBL 290-4 TaxID=2953890 RepID=UPI0020B7A1BF|nr:fatty acid--CoA ligase family protein [Chromobacterium sp. IIBBL 290-4]UTH76451.1 fatty acid--CoA ligase family protein [Chromobacterium sp. IIBBL 290-4]
MDVKRQWLVPRLRSFNSRMALIADCRHDTYEDIATALEQWLTLLDAQKVMQATVVVNGDYSCVVIGAILALYLRGCVVVPLYLADQAKIDEVATLTRARYVIGEVNAFDCRSIEMDGSVPPLIERLFAANESGLILLSSGSTGVPKAMLLSLDRLFARYVDQDEFSPMITAAFLLFDHVGGFNTLIYSLFNGGTLVKLNSRDPGHVCAHIERHKIELLPATPTFLNMLLIGGRDREYDLGSLKLITYGTESMPQSTLDNAVKAFPGVRLKQTYGMSELGILATRSEANDSLWMKIGGDGVGTRVVDNVLWVKTKTAMLGYLNAASPIDEDGWLCTGDVVEVREEYFKVLGREGDMINVGGLKVVPAEVESHLLCLPFVKDVVVWGKHSPVTGKIVAATVLTTEPMDVSEAKRQIVLHCRERLEPFKVPKFIEFAEGQLHSERFKKVKVRPQ